MKSNEDKNNSKIRSQLIRHTEVKVEVETEMFFFFRKTNALLIFRLWSPSAKSMNLLWTKSGEQPIPEGNSTDKPTKWFGWKEIKSSSQKRSIYTKWFSWKENKRSIYTADGNHNQYIIYRVTMVRLESFHYRIRNFHFKDNFKQKYHFHFLIHWVLLKSPK